MHELTEILVVSFIGFIKFGVPIVVAVWIIRTLRQIRLDHKTLLIRLDSIEQSLRQIPRNSQ